MAVNVATGGVFTDSGSGTSARDKESEKSKLVKYDPRNVILIFGAGRISGFATGTFISVERTMPSWELHVGTDGEVARTRMVDSSGYVRISLRAGSSSNGALSAILGSDEVVGLGAVPLLVRDFGGKSLHTAPFAYIEGFPVKEYGTEEATIEWNIRCPKLQTVIGGSDKASTSA